jgi:hypothetical protein
MIPLPDPVHVSELTLCQELLSTWIERHRVVLETIAIVALIWLFVGLFGTLDRITALVDRLWQHVRRRNAS